MDSTGIPLEWLDFRRNRWGTVKYCYWLSKFSDSQTVFRSHLFCTSKLLDCSETLLRNDILGALLQLSKLLKLYPECLTITDLEWDNYVLDSGHFGEIYKGRSCNQAICLKIIKVNRKTQIKHLLKVSLLDAFNYRKCLTSQAFFKEALLWGHLLHPNILPFYGIYHLEDTHGRISSISPWMENGNVT